MKVRFFPILAVLALLCLSSCGPREEAKAEPRTPEEVLGALREERAEIDAASDRILERIQRWNEAHAPGETIQFAELFPTDLTEAEQDVLDDLIAGERDISYRGLLLEIAAERENIEALQARIWTLEERLPGRFVTAARGDTHYDLALDYLIRDEGLEEGEARRHLAGINLFADLWPGHRVWLWHDRAEDRFATWVTRGEAARSPLAVQRAVRRGLIEDKEAALHRAFVLAEERDALADTLIGLRGDVRDLGLERQRLKGEVEELRGERSRLSADLDAVTLERDRLANSLLYHVATERELKKKGIVKDTPFTFPQLADPDRVVYDRALDLREGTVLELEPGAFGLKSVRKVILFPKFFQEGRDYRVVRRGGGAATLEILVPSAFRGRRIVIALRG